MLSKNHGPDAATQAFAYISRESFANWGKNERDNEQDRGCELSPSALVQGCFK